MNQVHDTHSEKILDLWTRIQNKEDLTPLKLLNEQAQLEGPNKPGKRVQVSQLDLRVFTAVRLAFC